MEQVTLGGTGLRVSRVALGTWQFSGSWGEVDEAAAVATIRGAMELGINFFDTARAYGFGAAETLLGRALRDELRAHRDEIVIATKGGVRKGPAGNVRDSRPALLRQDLEDSLRALDVDHVDIYLLHWPDETVPMEDIAATAQGFVDEGRVRYLGVSNFTVEQLRRLSRAARVSALQPPYSLLRRGIERDVLPYCIEHDIGVFVYGALAHGLLTGRYTPETTFADTDWRSQSPVFQGEPFARNTAMAARLAGYASGLGVSPARLAVAWTLARPGVHSTIVGGRRVAQIADAAGAADLRLTPEQLADVEAVASAGAPIGGPSPEGGVDQ